jgi:hypothetical protein
VIYRSRNASDRSSEICKWCCGDVVIVGAKVFVVRRGATRRLCFCDAPAAAGSAIRAVGVAKAASSFFKESCRKVFVDMVVAVALT